MIGLAMQAVGMAASMASQMVPNDNYVKKTSSYTPNSYSFQNAGLYNNAIGDIGEVDKYENISEQSNLSKGLSGLGSAFNLMGSTVFKNASFRGPGSPKSGMKDWLKNNNMNIGIESDKVDQEFLNDTTLDL